MTIKKTSVLATLLFAVIGAFSQIKENNVKDNEAGNLENVFLTPPEAAKPRGYWLWPHGNFDYSSIKKELREFKEKGLGGVDIFDLGVSDDLNVIPEGPGFFSQQQLDGIAFALKEAKKLDLEIGLIVSSSWNAGATWTPVEQGLMQLLIESDTITGPTQFNGKIPFPEIPKTFEKPYGVFSLHVPMQENGLPEFYEDVAYILYPLNDDGVIDNVEQIKVLNTNEYPVEVPEGKWVVMRAVYTNFGQMLWLPSDNSNGLTMDHYSKEAARFHFQTVIDKLEERCGPIEETALKRFYLASYESDVQITWSPTLEDKFYEINKYHIKPYLPALQGAIIKDKETTERFLYDYRLTVSEMLVHNLYREVRDLCHEYGLEICSESGGPGPPIHSIPTEDLKALGSVDIIRGEFWNTGDPKKYKENGFHVAFNEEGFNPLQVVKSVASAVHTYNHTIVEMESFTSFSHWQEGPMTLKPYADLAFCEGMNRVVYHTMAHGLPESGLPGWSFQAGTHINTNLTWWDLSYPFHNYLTRTSALLQQGLFVADACFYYGHEIPNFAKPKHILSTLGEGYDYDDINTEMLLTAQTKNNKIVLPGGMSYEVLILPDDIHMDLEILQKVDQLLTGGATIIGKSKPQRIYGLANYEEKEKELKRLADKLWGDEQLPVIDKKIGEGRFIVGKTARNVLQDKGIVPDVEYLNYNIKIDPIERKNYRAGLDYIHRHANNEDIYFVRNASEVATIVDVKFRVKNKQPQFWDPVTGEMQKCLVYTEDGSGTHLQLMMGAQASIFVIFKNEPQTLHVTSVKEGKKQLFPLLKESALVSFDAESIENKIYFSATKSGNYEITLSDKSKKKIKVEKDKEYVIEGEWDVRFPHGWSATILQTFDSLYSWTESSEEGTRTFSGTAIYRKSFTLTSDFLADDSKKILDLGDVGEVAHVYLNGKELGYSGFSPYKFDVTGVIRNGENYLVVEVANTWLNRLIADADKPLNERSTHTNLVKGNGQLSWKELTPLPSGLLGPVKIIGQKYYMTK